MKRKMKVGVIGANGLLGSALKEHFKADGITRETYERFARSKHYDLIINANGNSNRHWGITHAVEDFQASTASVYESMFDFYCTRYVYISSTDVGRNVYGFHKELSEIIVAHHKTNYLILRCSALLGRNLKKGVVYDLQQNGNKYVDSESKIQFIGIKEVAKIIAELLYLGINRKVLNVGGKGSTTVSFIENALQVKGCNTGRVTHQEYSSDVSELFDLCPFLKTSDEYVLDYLAEAK